MWALGASRATAHRSFFVRLARPNGGKMTVLISHEALSDWLNTNKLVLSVSFDRGAGTYRAELYQRHPNEELFLECTGRAADYDVAVIGACNRLERERRKARELRS